MPEPAYVFGAIEAPPKRSTVPLDHSDADPFWVEAYLFCEPHPACNG